MKNRVTFSILLATTFAGAAAILASNVNSFNPLGRMARGDSGGWIHYSSYNGGCTCYSIKEYWTDCHGVTTVEQPEGSIVEERELTATDVDSIISTYGTSDSRVFIAGHDLHNGVCSKCNEIAMTNNVVDTYSGHGTKGTATLVEDNTYSSDGYGTMYKYTHLYNDGVTKFPISNIFNESSLEGISKVQFKIVVPEYRFFIAGDDSNNYEIYASANGNTQNPVSTIITITRNGETNNWTLVDSAKIIRVYAGNPVNSVSLSNRTTFAELFHSFTNWGASNVYISDIMTNKHVCNFNTSGICECGYKLITSSVIASPSTLTVDTKYSAPLSLGNVKMFKRSGYGSNLFASTSLEDLTELKFYIVNEDSGNGFILNSVNSWSDYQGLIQASSAPQVVVAKKSGSDWVVTTESGLHLYAAGTVSSTAGPSYTVSNPSTLTDILKTLSASQSIYISDIVAKDTKEVITNQAFITGEFNGKTYSLTETSTVAQGFPKVYSYSCSSFFRAMFTDISISSYKKIEFYYDASGSNDQITFKYGDSYFGFHKGSGNVTGNMTATNLGDGTWKLTTSNGLKMRLANGSLITEVTQTGCTKLNELFQVTGDGWANTPILISDIIVTK